jgi:hypothetical protein
MSNPDFKTMSEKELREYFLAHRDNQDVFYSYIDKLNAEGKWIEMPYLESLEDLENYPEFTERVRRKSAPNDTAA